MDLDLDLDVDLDLDLSIAIPLDSAEGSGKSTGPDQRRFYAIARGSAMECAAIVDACMAPERVLPVQAHEADELLAPVIRMLSRMCRSREVQVQVQPQVEVQARVQVQVKRGACVSWRLWVSRPPLQIHSASRV